MAGISRNTHERLAEGRGIQLKRIALLVVGIAFIAIAINVLRMYKRSVVHTPGTSCFGTCWQYFLRAHGPFQWAVLRRSLELTTFVRYCI